MFDEKSSEVGRLLLFLDFWLTLFMMILAYRIQSITRPDIGELYSYVALVLLLWVPLSYFLRMQGIYRRLRIGTLINFGGVVLKSLALSIALLLVILFMLNVDFISRSVIILFVLLESFILIAVRGGLVWWYFRKSLESGDNFLKVLIIGTGERAKNITKMLHKHTEWGLDVLGYLDSDEGMSGTEIEGKKVLGTIDKVGDILTNQVVDEVILAVPRTMISDVESIIRACEVQGVKLRWMGDIFNMRVSRVRLVDLGGIPMLTFEPVAQNEKMLLVKRLFDLSVVILAMPFILPVMALTALAIKLDSPGPIFFEQSRVGLRKRLFPMKKFRSMFIDAEDRLKEIEHLNEAEGPIFKIKNDPRITRVGRFIRKTSIDELPQLFNVIRGHMSLVGPRPMSKRDVDLFDQEIQRKRFSVRPGITCIWQVSGRSDLTFDEWLELDLKYIDSWSFWLDIKLLFKTIPVVLKARGAV